MPRSLPMRFAAQSMSFEVYKQRGMKDRDVHDMAIRFWDAGALGSLEIPRLIKEWREPKQPTFAEGPKTVWRLFNAATEVIKGDLWRLPARTRAIHAILDEVCGLEENAAPSAPAALEAVAVAA